MPAEEYFEFSDLARRASSGEPPVAIPAQAADPTADAPGEHTPVARDLSQRSDLYPVYQHGDRWAGVPEELRLDWCRALLDFPPYFPGPSFMVYTAQAIRGDRVATPLVWPLHAASFHRLGFTAVDWYMLRLCLDRRLEELLARGDERFVVDTTGPHGYRTCALIPEDWTDWLALGRAGLTPLRAFDLIVDGDRRSWPGGSIIDGDDGTVIASA
ncbi:hypothetical protein [Agromyces seonyuensis]|uniref:Uncharacterized protein n=1 Tax=Agromyces seonyuensis TaxID=2662446 RepID=A0A6I4NT84_9MICO|nr:hypothetical protein [Agromyces seonyuensis]MWB97648.1 hypothetical protein [Agromyces seonyuensis]